MPSLPPGAILGPPGGCRKLVPQPVRRPIGRAHLVEHLDDPPLALVQLGQLRGAGDPRPDLVATRSVERSVGERGEIGQLGERGSVVSAFRGIEIVSRVTTPKPPVSFPKGAILHDDPSRHGSAKRCSQPVIWTRWSPRCASRCQLGEPFDDPGVAQFGLRNAVFAIGDTFLEVVSPSSAGHLGRAAARPPRRRLRLHADVPGAGPGRRQSARERAVDPRGVRRRARRHRGGAPSPGRHVRRDRRAQRSEPARVLAVGRPRLGDSEPSQGGWPR